MAAKKVGRPPANRVALSLRVSPEVKQRLDDLAEKSGRSISQEAELRLEQSFRTKSSSLLSWPGPMTPDLPELVSQSLKQ